MSKPLAALEAHAIEAFQREFGHAPQAVASAPARVELLGNHTDYNGGLVMSAAINRQTVVAGACNNLARIRLFSEHFGDRLDVSAVEFEPSGFNGWRRYALGVINAIGAKGTSGIDAILCGDIPLGAGLSSSASLEAAIALLLLELCERKAPTSESARFQLACDLQRVENEVVGVSCGLLDQFSVLLGREAHALWLDCATQAHGKVAMGGEALAIVVCDTKTSRRLADGKYNQRRTECEQVVAYFKTLQGAGQTRWLRDISLASLQKHWHELDPVGRLRARHVITESERVKEGIKALSAGDVTGFGRLMSASHTSSRDDFCNSSHDLDFMVRVAESAPGFIGGKLSGAGWAGCTVNLVRAEASQAFSDYVRSGYTNGVGSVPEIHVCHASDGARVTRLLA